MSTQSLTDQLRLLEEEIYRLIKMPYGCTKLQGPCERLLAVAKGLEAELAKAQADLLPHYAAIKAGDKLVDELSKELAALREENERCRQALEWIKTLEVPGNEILFKTLAMKMKADEALASLSK